MMAREPEWYTDPNLAPKVSETDTIIFSEHGRIAFNIDYRSHWFTLIKLPSGGHVLLVSHGAGEEAIQLPRCRFEHVVDVLAGLSSDLRYLMLHQLFNIHRDGRTLGREAVECVYKKAFADGRLKKSARCAARIRSRSGLRRMPIRRLKRCQNSEIGG